LHGRSELLQLVQGRKSWRPVRRPRSYLFVHDKARIGIKTSAKSDFTIHRERDHDLKDVRYMYLPARESASRAPGTKCQHNHQPWRVVWNNKDDCMIVDQSCSLPVVTSLVTWMYQNNLIWLNRHFGSKCGDPIVRIIPRIHG
jgi:hypothetical protein